MRKRQPIQPGEKFGRLKAIKVIEKHPVRGHKWLCICSCPNYTAVEAYASVLRTGKIKSCGCFPKGAASVAKKYFAFGQEMTISELAEKSKEFHDEPLQYDIIYDRITSGWDAERAVKAPRWKKTFFAFGKEMTMDDLRGKSKDFHRVPLSQQLIRKRLAMGWDIEKAVTTPRKLGGGKKKRNLSLEEIAALSGEYLGEPLSIGTVRKRLKLGWSIEEVAKTPRFSRRK